MQYLNRNVWNEIRICFLILPFSDWIEQEKRTFAEEKDKNGDGYLDRDELEAWIVPSEVNYSQEEAEHLVKVR